MNKTVHAARSTLTAGDAAVDGLFSGVLAGIPMAVYAAAAWLLFDPGAGEGIAGFLADRGLSLVSSILLHLAVSSVYGLLYSLGYNLLARSAPAAPSPWVSTLAGTIYGGLLLALAHLVILPVGAAPLRLSFGLSVPAHLIYGAVLGLLVHRSRYNPAH